MHVYIIKSALGDLVVVVLKYTNLAISTYKC